MAKIKLESHVEFGLNGTWGWAHLDIIISTFQYKILNSERG